MRKNLKKNQCGGTIVEVLIAALIFAATLFALVGFQANLLHERAFLDQEAEALSTAQDKMQSFRNYTALVTPTPNPTNIFAYDAIVSGSSTVSGLSADYSLSWNVVNSTDLPTRKTVTITVTWTDQTNTPHTLVINSIIASIDPKATGKIAEHLP